MVTAATWPALEPTLSDRVHRLHREVLVSEPTLCAERALLVTRYFRRHARRDAPMVVQKAEALAHVLTHRRVEIFPGELLVGNFTSHRLGGGLFPELHGVAMLLDLFRFDDRATNPFRVRKRDALRLLSEVLPYWLPRFLGMRIGTKRQALRFVRDQLDPTLYLVNETGGISHFVPDYARLLAGGTEGLLAEVEAGLAARPVDDASADFLRAVRVVLDGLERFAARYCQRALDLAAAEADATRRAELEAIAAACDRVPRRPARTLQEALQCLILTQVALNLESLDNSVSPGRLDQILYPYYRDDLEAGRLDPAGALELLGCYAVKLCEILPLFSKLVTRFHGGLFNGQVVVVGGTDEAGRDATNPLTHLFVELMDQLRTRQPNYHARLHRGSPPALRARISRALAGGAVSPAVYNDEVIVPILRARGVSAAHARDYATVGCVEPVAAGRSFFSTDAALFNLPLCLELALNQGRRFGREARVGAATPPAADCATFAELVDLLAAQIRHGIDRLLSDLGAVELANARFHPTPLTSALLDGCLVTATDSTAGGARYNGSGIQGVGAVEVGDSLAAIRELVFERGRLTLSEIIDACRRNFAGHEILHHRLRHAPKYGNDDPRADGECARVVALFADGLVGRFNTRGGAYVAGFYSVTAHQAFGELVGALPSGRRAGEPFSSGISPSSGLQRRGPTAALRSAASLPLERAPNGVNFNLELAPSLVAGERGAATLQGLIDGGFASGCMQMQVNVLDPATLIAARDNPGRYPSLLVRVSGYSAYFDDLSPAVQQEIIDRTLYDRDD